MQRVQEPERMTSEEERLYAVADYAGPHEAFADYVVEVCDREVGARLIDLGTGPGDIPLRIAGKRPRWKFVGVDASEPMLAFARSDGRNIALVHQISWVCADVKNTGLPAGTFDVVISNSVLHHLADPNRFWSEVRRLAAPGATVLVRDLARPTNPETARRLVEIHVRRESSVVQSHYLSSLYSAYRLDEVRSQLRVAGFTEFTVSMVEDRYLEVVATV